ATGSAIAAPSRRHLRATSCILAGVLALLLFCVFNSGSIIPVIVAGGIGFSVLVYKAARHTRSHRESLIAVLIAITIVVDCFFLEGYVRAALHYGLVFLFCV